MGFHQYLSTSLAAILILISHATIVANSPAGAATLPPEEVEALVEIGKTLGKNWNFSVDPCSGELNWTTPNALKGFENAVNCSCSYANNKLCHVTGIVLKGQNLQGTLPPEVIRLPILQEIDLSRNYLNGTIPTEWGSMQLLNISLLGNRVSGTIPKTLANITTLKSLVLEFNQLSGSIPEEFGNLARLERLHLTSNNFTGELPGTLSKLTTLKDFRIGDNQFEGGIPDFIQNWTNIEKLMIQGSGLNGPIPLGIASLTNLIDLRISDLNGNDSAFPYLRNAKNLTTLILRSCNIVGQLPPYLGSLTKWKNVLDLSFNKITGPIPESFSALSSITGYIYMTGNFLTGQVSHWMLTGKSSIDLSFNNFTLGSSGASNCQTRELNLFASSSRDNTSGLLSCWKSFHCPRDWYYRLHINCGGTQVEVENDTSYDEDRDLGGSSRFYSNEKNWAFSSTGHFLDDHIKDSYILENRSRIFGNNSQLYMTARLSPLSLTYYGFCLLNGNYTVNLHFAEILFTEDRTYSSLGKRLFDIYIQGKLVKKDFSIEDEAGGVNRPIVEPFPAQVFDNTLEIRFYWAGKGTVGIPDRGVYGPLISAISAVNHDYTPPSKHHNGLPAGAIVGIVLAVLFSISLLLVVLRWRGLRCKETMEHDLMGLDLHTGSFTLRQLKAATNNFDAANKIGEGGFGSVYKGNLYDGTVIAVKQLSSKSNQGNREFVNEIGMVSALQHPNLVKLYGCCIEANQLLLVYEYMENNCLARALFGPKEHQLKLDWPARHNISVGIARGLAHLHEESRLKIVHRDIKATNVLLDKILNPKISDFGLAKLHEEESSHISTRIAGTFGYMAPEYAMRGYLTDKADVYSFGIVLLEIVSGKCNTSIKPKEECFYLLDLARVLKEEGKLMELVDSRLGSDFDSDKVMLTINVALLCTDISPNLRPNMSRVVGMLDGRANEQLISDYSGLSSEKTKVMEMSEMRKVTDSYDSQTISTSTNVPPGTASSTSVSDLYPVSLSNEFSETKNEDGWHLLR